VLTNRQYTGKVHCQGQSYAGEHTAIVEERVWQRVQSMVVKDGRSNGRLNQPPTPPSDLQQPGRQPGVPCELKDCEIRGESQPVRTPRIARLLALALKFEGLIQQGVVKDYAELARLGQVSRARVTQIMNLLNLAPDIQEEILTRMGDRGGKQRIWESSLRTLSSEVIWIRQLERWKHWTGRHLDPGND